MTALIVHLYPDLRSKITIELKTAMKVTPYVLVSSLPSV